jgi:hypothetical protein
MLPNSCKLRIMSSGMWRNVSAVNANVSEERIASIIRVKISELGTTLAIPSNWFQLLGIANAVPSSPTVDTLMMEVTSLSETSILTRTTQSNIPEHCIFQTSLNSRFNILTNVLDTTVFNSRLLLGLVLVPRRCWAHTHTHAVMTASIDG